MLFIILKTIVFPQSGGENQGGTFSKGKAKIKKTPIRNNREGWFFCENGRLFFILFYDTNKI